MSERPGHDADRIRHLGGLSAIAGPPYVTFQQDEDESGTFYSLWIASPPTLDIESLNMAMNSDAADAAIAARGMYRVLTEHFDYELTPAEDALLDRYRAADTGPDFWAAVDAAGLRYVPPEELQREAPGRKRGRPRGPVAVGTYPELAVIGFAAADARTGRNWAEVAGGDALVHTRKKDGYQVRYAPSAPAGRWADPEPGALSSDLFSVLAANGGLDTVFLAQVGAALALGSERHDVTLDDLGRMIGRDPRSTKEREEMRRDLWGRLRFLDGLTVWGARKGTYRDPVTRKQVPIESRDPLFMIAGTMWPEQRTLDGSEIPLSVSFAAGAFLAQFKGRPDVLQTYGDYQRLAAIAGEKPSGAWARSIGLALTQRWRERASYGGVMTFTVDYLLGQFPPAPTADEVLASANPKRARKYLADALARLKQAGVIAGYTLPDEDTLPRTGWAAVWRAWTVTITPPAAVLESSATLEARRAEEAEKAAAEAKPKPRRRRRDA